MVTKRNEEVSKITQFLKSKGIDAYKYKKKGFFSEKNGYQTWFKKNIEDVIHQKYLPYNRGIPTVHYGEFVVNGIKLTNNQSPTYLVELYDRLTYQYQSKMKEKRKTDKLLIKSIEYANEHHIDIEDLPPEYIISVVSDEAKEQYREEHLPVGTEVYLKHECDSCNTYIVG